MVALDVGERTPEEYASPVGFPTQVAPLTCRVTKYIAHAPRPKQRLFLLLRCLEAFYGGAAGGGKSDALLAGALQFVDVPNYNALIMRRRFKDLSQPDAIIDVADEWLHGTDAVWNAQLHRWTFPSGATLTFGHAQHPRDVQDYRSAQFQYIGIDESTQFLEGMYRFMFSRLRRPAVPCVVCEFPATLRTDGWHHADDDLDADHEPDYDPSDVAALGESEVDGLSILQVPLRMRTASNPGDVGHAFHKTRFVDAETRAPSVVFIPAKLEDNPHLDPVSYERSLREMEPIGWARMRHGDWEVRDPAQIFDKTQVRIVDAPYPRIELDTRYARVRYWDMAATEAKSGTDPDWAVGFLLGLDRAEGRFRIEHIRRLQGEPSAVEAAMVECAELDGRDVPIWVEQEPGSESKLYIAHLRRHLLRGYKVDGDPVSDPKDVRIRFLEPLINHGDVEIVRGPYVTKFLDELDAWPFVDHDDQLDAFCGAHRMLTAPRGRVLV